MKTMLTVSSVMIAAALLLTGCTKSEPVTADSPLVSEAEGLGDQKVPKNYFAKSQFSEVYDSTNGAISFEKLDDLDWKVERVLESSNGEALPEGDNFKATATSNLSYNTVVKEWSIALKKDGWEAVNEVKAEPRADEERYHGSAEDYRAKPYAVELTKGKSKLNVNIKDNLITLTINSQ